MKNMIEICKDFGFEIPEDKQTEFLKAVNGEYKTVAEYEKAQNKLSAATQRAESAEETLKGFEGKDFDAITRERDEWKRKYDQNVAAYQRQQEEDAFNDLLKNAVTEAKGRNSKAICALLDLEKLRGSRNQERDVKAALESLKADNGYLFEDNGGAAKFTQPNHNNGGGAITVKDIMAIKDPTERQAKIAQNMQLFQKG